MPEGTQHTPATIRAALDHVSPDCDRETWVRVLAGVKSWDGDGARDLAQEWSARGSAYKAADFRATWKSLRAAGGVTIATVFKLAKDGGFSLGHAADTKSESAGAPDRAAERAARDRAEDARRALKRDQAAAEARHLVDAAYLTGKSPYLELKGIGAHGVLFQNDGALLVPMVDATGALRNVQTITPDGRKKYLPGGQAADLLHWIGDPSGAATIALAEGYGTGATIHETTGLPVAVAFTAGNLPSAARIVREAYPDAMLVICADDDRATEKRSGKNPGLNAAREAARGGRAVVAIPAPLELEETDFNDLARRAGAAAVATIVQAAMAKHVLRSDAGGDEADTKDSTAVDDHFRLTDKGVYYRATDRNGGASLQWVCDPLEVEARTRDGDGGSWGFLLAFNDPEGTHKRLAIPARLFAGDSTELRARLSDEGLSVAAGPARNRLAHYIATRYPKAFVRVAETIGWHGDGYVLPHRSFGASAAGLFYQSGDERSRNPFREHGTLDAWIGTVAKLCQGSPRLVFPVALAFAGPTLHLLEMLSGGFHFYGASSKGKTTALAVGASVWGRPELGGFVRTWRATGNALEAVAAAHSDATLFLDELREVEPREVVQTVLMLGNGSGKQRMKSGGSLRVSLSWRLLYMSTGERRVEELAAIAGLPVDAGAGVRLVEIPVPETGAFDNLHGIGDGAQFAETIRAAALESYGTAGTAWLEYLTANRVDAQHFLRDCVRELLDAWLERATDAGQVSRVAQRFALVAAAGELATRAGITGWTVGESERAARRLFDDWLAARGTRGDAEELAAVRQVASVLSSSGEAFFPWWHRAADDHRPNALKRWGLRKLIAKNGDAIDDDKAYYANYGDKAPAAHEAEGAEAEYYVLASLFREEVSKGFDPKFVARVLQRRGHLVPEGDRLDRKERLPGIGPSRVYRIKPSIFADDAL